MMFTSAQFVQLRAHAARHGKSNDDHASFASAPNRASNIRKLLCKFYYYKWLVLHTHIFKFHHVTLIASRGFTGAHA